MDNEIIFIRGWSGRMSVQRFFGLMILGGACCLIASCGANQSGPKIKKVPVYKVSGVITIDGKPEAGVKLSALSQSPDDAKDQARQAMTNAEGKFEFSTYESNDGLPEGEYAVLISWPPGRMTMGKKQELHAKDGLHGKYNTPETSPLKFKVEKGKSLKLEPLDLTAKE